MNERSNRGKIAGLVLHILVGGLLIWNRHVHVQAEAHGIDGP